MEKARSLIFDSNQDKELWGEAVRTAAYLTNRSPTETLQQKTPFEMWNERKPNLKYVQLFGTTAHAKQTGYLKKLDERSKKLIFIGYAPQGYRLYDSISKQVIISRDVIFENLNQDLKQNKTNEGDLKDIIK